MIAEGNYNKHLHWGHHAIPGQGERPDVLQLQNPVIFIPHGMRAICSIAFKKSSIAALLIPSSVERIEMLALGPDTRMQDIYFCGTQAQWDAIGKTNNNIIADKTVHYVAGLRAGLVRPDGGESGEFSVHLVFSGDGETPLDALCGVVLCSAGHAGRRCWRHPRAEFGNDKHWQRLGSSSEGDRSQQRKCENHRTR